MKVLRTQFCDRIREFRESTGLSQAAFASKYGVTKSSYQKYELGLIQPGADAIEKLLAAGVNANWLLTGEGPMMLGDQASGTYPTHQPREHAVNQTPAAYSCCDDGLVDIPMYRGLRASAGYGAVIEIEYDEIKLLKFNETWLRRELGINPAYAAVFLVVGDSMSPAFNDGDVCMMDTSSRRIEREGVYFLQSGDMGLLKRVRAIFGGGLEIISDNPSYPAYRISAEELQTANFSVIGRVVWVGKRC